MTYINIIETVILWTGFGIGPAICVILARKYYIGVKEGKMQRKEAIKIYAAASFIAPIASIAWIYGLGKMGQSVGLDIFYGETTGWAVLSLLFFVLAISLLSIGVFAAFVSK